MHNTLITLSAVLSILSALSPSSVRATPTETERLNAFFEELGKPIAAHNYASGVEDTLDALAAHLETHFDIDRLLELAG